ncbi:MAG TPA: hypothetical protein VJB94_03510 [Candidatus Nanoarchaeia archaeon]|nr:hypothetical protein [Candidatus Nanoarchaeia archaeon]
MANPLQIGLLNFLTPAFVFMLVFGILYAFLTKTKLFGESLGVNSLIAFTISILFLLFPGGQAVVKLITPWFFLLFLLTILLVAFFIFLGASDKDIVTNVVKNNTVLTIIISAIVIVFLVALSQVYGDFLSVNTGSGYWMSVKRSILNAKVLGAVLILIIGSYVVRFVAAENK